VIWVHIVCSAVALLTGPWQLSSRVRSGSLLRHRWMGRAYVGGVFIGGAAGLILATTAQGGPPARFGFGVLAILWIGSTAMGFVRILERDIALHRAWMIRSYALTCAAITLRIYMPLSEVAGIPFQVAYPVVAWLCWVPNLVVVEWITLQGRVEYGSIKGPSPTP
jgi:hypothetical protein